MGNVYTNKMVTKDNKAVKIDDKRYFISLKIGKISNNSIVSISRVFRHEVYKIE